MQAIGVTAPDLPPKPGLHTAFARDHEYKRHGALSLLAGIDLLTGKVHALVEERHRSREFIEFLQLLAPSSPAPCCATSASPPNRNSKTASWPPSTTSTNSPSFTRGLTNLTGPLDMILISETVYSHDC